MSSIHMEEVVEYNSDEDLPLDDSLALDDYLSSKHRSAQSRPLANLQRTQSTQSSSFLLEEIRKDPISSYFPMHTIRNLIDYFVKHPDNASSALPSHKTKSAGSNNNCQNLDECDVHINGNYSDSSLQLQELRRAEEDNHSEASFCEEETTILEAIVTITTTINGRVEVPGLKAFIDTGSCTSCISRLDIQKYHLEEKPIPKKEIRTYSGIGMGKVRPLTYVNVRLKCFDLELTEVKANLRVIDADVGMILGMPFIENNELMPKLYLLRKPNQMILILKDSRSKGRSFTDLGNTCPCMTDK